MDAQRETKPEFQREQTNVSSQQESTGQIGTHKISGSCACGSVKWESTHNPSRGSFCYCITCRKLSGGAFLAFMDFPASSITFIPAPASPSSTLKLMSISENAERGFCITCGSTLTMRYRAAWETLYLTIASVDEETGNGKIDALDGLDKKHIYVRDKVDWYQLPDDGLPRFDTMPNEAKYLVFGD